MLHPLPENIESGYLPVGNRHKLYYEVSGNPEGVPILYLHGGPGGGISGREHQYFNPEKYKIILLDQRGAGKSTPYASTNHNSPEYLIEDLERLRRHLDIKNWIVTGGSWGSCLALLYTIKYPKRAKRLLLRGLFFGDLKGAQYIIEEWGAAQTQPKYFEQYARAPFVPKDAQSNLTKMYYEIFEMGTRATQLNAALRFNLWDTSIAYREINEDALEAVRADKKKSLALAKLFFHFTVNAFALNDYKGRIFSKETLLKNIRVDIVHGECDWICPVQNAYEFKALCPHASVNIVPGGGHTMADPLIRDAFIETIENWGAKR